MGEEWEEWMDALGERSRELYERLALHGVRIFALRLREGSEWRETLWIHDGKTVDEWREDIREYMRSSLAEDDEGGADGDVFNGLTFHLTGLGYANVSDVAVDVFEGRVQTERARLVDSPEHEEQADGFGHFGWENGRGEVK